MTNSDTTSNVFASNPKLPTVVDGPPEPVTPMSLVKKPLSLKYGTLISHLMTDRATYLHTPKYRLMERLDQLTYTVRSPTAKVFQITNEDVKLFQCEEIRLI